MESSLSKAPRPNLWSTPYRAVVFILSASSIWSLLSDFFGWASMRSFTLLVFLPSLAALALLVLADWVWGNRRLVQAVFTGTVAGLLAAVSYDIFRLPFVFAKPLGLQQLLPPLNLYKVFPQFGAMILAQPLQQTHYSVPTQLVGWAYHFSNGLTFGIMYMALVGNPKLRHWPWAVLFAVGLEVGMLFTPYPAFFQIPLTASFVVVTLLAHLLFGIVIGFSAPGLFRFFTSRYSSLPLG